MPKKLSDYIGSSKPECLDRDEIKKVVESTLATFLSKILDNFKLLEDRVNKIQADLERLEKICEKSPVSEVRMPKHKNKKQSKLLEEFILLISEEGYAFLSKLINKIKVKPAIILTLAHKTGYVVLDLSGDYAILEPETYQEFILRLSNINTPDPIEASRKIGKFSLLFDKLRESSQVFFDARSRKWRLIS